MTDLDAVKERQQKMWATGDFSKVGATTVITGELLCEAADLLAGQKVLDVATGSGSTALAAARRWCEVTGIDFVPALLERGRERATAEGLNITFLHGDAENIPFPDSSFDVVLSTYGAMFAPNQERAALELLRVCRPTGRIAMANWTPDGFYGETFRVLARHVPVAPGLNPPTRWGTEKGIQELFGDAVGSVQSTRRSFMLRYRSPEQYIQYFRDHFGPMKKAYEALDAAQQEQLTQDLLRILNEFNRTAEAALVVPSEYLEVVAVKR